jgi:hypothetical protein
MLHAFWKSDQILGARLLWQQPHFYIAQLVKKQNVCFHYFNIANFDIAAGLV